MDMKMDMEKWTWTTKNGHENGHENGHGPSKMDIKMDMIMDIGNIDHQKWTWKWT